MAGGGERGLPSMRARRKSFLLLEHPAHSIASIETEMTKRNTNQSDQTAGPPAHQDDAGVM